MSDQDGNHIVGFPTRWLKCHIISVQINKRTYLTMHILTTFVRIRAIFLYKSDDINVYASYCQCKKIIKYDRHYYQDEPS